MMYPEVQTYFKQKKKLHDTLLTYLEENEELEFKFQSLSDSKKEDFEKFLDLLTYISNNHTKTDEFSNKIGRILLNYKRKIKQTFSNSELLNIFESNKLILLFLLKNQFIVVDDLYNQYKNVADMCHFFFPEIKQKLDDQKAQQIEEELLEKDSNIFDNFEEKRKIGENDSYICTLIRYDSIQEFISYVTQSNFCLTSKIEPSIFETNQFLNDNQPTLIEYAAFFGSIKVFNYLRMAGVDLTPSLWLYSVHSNQATMIHLLETLHIQPPDNSYNSCLLEAIKCHHNNIALYILNNLIVEKDSLLYEKIDDCCMRYSNYSCFYDESTGNDAFFYYCKCNSVNIVDIGFEKEKDEIEKFII
ncbi:hypothetical protein M9Y10_000376 [Tritrichomonas musculus]|uniref:DUF3447 domain-containing protein n=1 Tax=Tritrichomonas musculus TaxID=1915356 RepID=A0ABR2L4I0_9EUKA